MRDRQLREAKAVLRSWFRDRDEAYLTRVVEECRSGVFCFWDPCHCLVGLMEGRYSYNIGNPVAAVAEAALRILKILKSTNNRYYGIHRESMTRARTLPLVLAEIKRRNKLMKGVRYENQTMDVSRLRRGISRSVIRQT